MHYQKGDSRHQLSILSLDQLIADDAFVRIIDLLVDVMPLEELGFKHTQLNSEGAPPFHPRDLFKLWLYGYRYQLRSGSKLAKACHINLEVKWLINNLTPSIRTVNYFRANNAQAIINANKHFVQLLRNWKMIGGDLLAVDSTKIDGQNSLKNNFNHKKIKRHLDYLQEKIERINDQLEQEALKNKNKRNYTDKEQELADELEQAVGRKEFYEDVQEQVDKADDGQVSLTDPDARAVVIKRNIVKVGYSIQATVDAKNKMVVDVFKGGVNDMNDLGKAAKRAQHILDRKHFDLLADAGYNNGAEIAYTERLGVRPFVAPRRNHQQSNPGFRKSDFAYNKISDTYTCPAGEKLEFLLSFKRGSNKRPYNVRRYATLNCAVCTLRDQCTTSKQGRFIERPAHSEIVERHNRRVQKHRLYYRQRQAIVEHVFGTWKRHWGLTHAHLKSKRKVLAEYNITALLYNLQRLLSIEGADEVKLRLKKLILIFYPASSPTVHLSLIIHHFLLNLSIINIRHHSSC